jgi:hypothetical protein
VFLDVCVGYLAGSIRRRRTWPGYYAGQRKHVQPIAILVRCFVAAAAAGRANPTASSSGSISRPSSSGRLHAMPVNIKVLESVALFCESEDDGTNVRSTSKEVRAELLAAGLLFRAHDSISCMSADPPSPRLDFGNITLEPRARANA